MNAIVAGTGLALVLSAAVPLASAAAQNRARPAACYVEVQKLMAEPPAGIGDLRTAVHKLDANLGAQIEEVKLLKAELEGLRQRQQIAMEAGNATELAELDEAVRDTALDLDAKQAKLRADYTEQRRAVVGPVQTRVSERARAFGTAHGCAAMKMARTRELASLRAEGARNVTGEFVAWYGNE